MRMRVSQKFGGLPYVSSIWNFGPLAAAAIMIVADFGIICALMYVEGVPPWQRDHYRAFLWNDTVFIPLYVAMVVVILRDAPAFEGFFTKRWWHILVLGLSFAGSIMVEVGAVASGQYTMSQELSPSKLWHTVIFGIVGYWIVSPAIPVLLLRAPTWAMVGLAIAFSGSAFNVYRDITVKPVPANVHLEGTYFPWEWRARTN